MSGEPLATTLLRVRQGVLGERTTREKVGLRGRQSIVWAACPGCGLERWVALKPPNMRCRSCANRTPDKLAHLDRIRTMPSRVANRDQRGAKNHAWKGGRRPAPGGYVYLLVQEDDPYRSMAGRDRYVLEHRIVVARSLGRPLRWFGPGHPDSEHIHHLNGDKTDNRLDNLELWTGTHPRGVRAVDGHHCAGCRCFEEAR